MKDYIQYKDDIGFSIKDMRECPMNQIFRTAAKMIAFDDCTGIEVTDIVINGKKYFYTGWKPGMTYTFVDENGVEVWTSSFPEWDH